MIAGLNCDELLGAANGALWEFDARTALTTVHTSKDFGGAFAHISVISEASWYELTHPGDVGAISEVWLAVRRGEQPGYRIDWRIRGSDMAWHWIRSIGRVTEVDAHGRPLRIAGVYFDIDALKQAEAARDSSEYEIRAVLDGSPHPLLIIDEHCRAVRWNAAANALGQRIAGRGLSPGVDVALLSPINEPETARGYLTRALAGETIVVERQVGSGPSASWFEFSLRPLQPAPNGARRAAVAARDVTERRQMERIRAQTMKLESLGMLAGGVAHDFNNLLTAIIGNVELAVSSGQMDEWVLESLDDALTAARRAAEVAAYLLEYAGRRTTSAAPLECNRVVQETVRLLSKSMPPSVRVTTDSNAESACALADRTQLQQMLINLIINARDAVAEGGGRIAVETRAVTMTPELRARAFVATASTTDQYIAIAVEDDGPGMDSTTLARIFEPFFTTKPGGHGLGLASVLGAVRANNATLLLDSVPGRGTRFEVLFPAA